MAHRHDVVYQDVRVCWRRFGSGRPVVLLHGGHGCWMHWIRNIAFLARRFAVWIPDLPGYGESEAPRSPTLSGIVEATAATLDEVVGAGTAIDLVGFSFGGLVAAHVAAQRMNVRRLALLGPAGHGTGRRPRGVAVRWQHLVDQAMLVSAMRHNLAIQMIHSPEHIDALATAVHLHSCTRTRFHSKAFSRGDGLHGALDRHAGETLLVWGEHDVTANPDTVSAAICARNPQIRTHFIPGAGHWVQYESPAEINQLLADWLDGTTTEKPV